MAVFAVQWQTYSYLCIMLTVVLFQYLELVLLLYLELVLLLYLEPASEGWDGDDKRRTDTYFWTFRGWGM
jgi:hypothetical protein